MPEPLCFVERNEMIIAGSGMAGLLAANMLHRRAPVVVEVQSELPHNHSAVLRFRSPDVGNILGIPFRKVSMIKTALPWRNPIADALAYSMKNTGTMRSDRSIIAGMTAAERYIAPGDLIIRMSAPADIRFGTACDFKGEGPFISTIPMPALMKALDYPDQPEFHWRPAMNVKATITNCDAYISLLVPDPALPFSRISITGDELIIEVPGTGAVDEYTILRQAVDLLGIPPISVCGVHVHQSRYAKLLPIDEDQRRDFMFWATDQHSIFSLGRFACWRPGLLLDDLVQDIRKIDGWLDRKSRYDAARTR